jgi:hypothetical protein
MADEDEKTNFVITPKMRPPCDFGEKPAKKERIKWEKQERMGEVPMVLKIELTVNQTEEEVHVGKEPRHQARYGSPGLNFLVLYRLANDCPCERMGETIHTFIVTRRQSPRQMA